MSTFDSPFAFVSEAPMPPRWMLAVDSTSPGVAVAMSRGGLVAEEREIARTLGIELDDTLGELQPPAYLCERDGAAVAVALMRAHAGVKILVIALDVDEDPGVHLAPGARALLLVVAILLGLVAVMAVAIAARIAVGLFS